MSNKIAFLRGYPKSGTNWLCHILNLHPDISCHGEFHLEFLHKGFENTKNAEWGLMKRDPQILRQEYFKFIRNLIIEYCGRAKVCIDRTPISMRASFIPREKYIYIVRDGRDVVVSWLYHSMRLNIISHPSIEHKKVIFDRDNNFFEKNPNELLGNEHYVRSMARAWQSQVISDMKFMERADSGELKFNYYFVKYEDLHLNLERIRKELYSFLELDPNAAKDLMGKAKAGISQSNPNSFYRKGKAGGWKYYFTEEQEKWFLESADEIMRKLNYVPNS